MSPRSPAGAAPPRPLLLPALLGLAIFLLPLVGLATRAPWSGLASDLAAPEVLDALLLSFFAATCATLIALVLGLPLALLLARGGLPGSGGLRALVAVPTVLPPVAGGVALLLAFGPRGLLGPPLAALGIVLPFSTAAVVLAESFVAMPFLVLTVEAAVRALDPGLEEAAATLGAGPWSIFQRVTLPLLRAPLGAGLGLAWARALGEFGATITFAGSLPGRTQTMPLAVYQLLETRPDAAIALSLAMLAVSLAVLGLVGRRAGG